VRRQRRSAIEKLDARHQAIFDDLNANDAASFDKAYVDAHLETIDLFKDYVISGDHWRLRQFAEELLPRLHAHLSTMSKSCGEDRDRQGDVVLLGVPLRAVRWSCEGSPQVVHFRPLLDVPALDRRPFATLAWFARDAVKWTGTLAAFRSSPIAVRTHRGICGTPLSLAYDVALAVGTFDYPEAVKPTHHYGAESRVTWDDIGLSAGEEDAEHW
jgi:hypothetical protein